MKETILLTIALFMLSAPDPEALLERELPMQALAPLVTQNSTWDTMSGAPDLLAPITEMAEAETTAAPVANTIARVEYAKPVSVKGAVSAEWVFLEKDAETDEMLAQVEHEPITNAYRAGSSSAIAIQ